jgi:hypothetical protein
MLLIHVFGFQAKIEIKNEKEKADKAHGDHRYR